MIRDGFLRGSFFISNLGSMICGFCSPQKRRMRTRAVTSAIVLLSLSTSVTAQNGPHYLTLESHYGFMVPHRTIIRDVLIDHSYGGTLAAEWKVSGKKRWHHLYKKPVYGLEFCFADLGNPVELGQQFSLSSTIRLPLGKSERMRHHVLTGLGLGYSTVQWDIEENLKGITIGSALNFTLSLGYYLEQPISERVELFGGLRITHLSNGAVSLPNLGTNNVSLVIGARLNRRPDFEPENPIFLQYLPKQRNIYAFVTTGIKENSPPGGPTFFVHTASVSYEHRRNWKTSFFVRADVFANTAIRPLLQRDGVATGKGSDILQSGIGVGYAKHFGRLRFDMMMGVYLFNRFEGNGRFYHRFNFRYTITERWLAQVGLKTHLARADHPEVGLIYRIH